MKKPGYEGKLEHTGAQKVEAPFGRKSGKSGVVKTGSDLRVKKSAKHPGAAG